MLPFLLRSVHVALLAVKDDQIAALRTELAESRADRHRAEMARDAAIVKTFELLTPKPVEVAPAPQRPPRPAPPAELDLSRIDPSDNIAIRDLALSEMPLGRANASLLTMKMESIRGQIHAAHAARSARAREVGTIELTPPDVEAQIDAAIAQGKQQARTN